MVLICPYLEMLVDTDFKVLAMRINDSSKSSMLGLFQSLKEQMLPEEQSLDPAAETLAQAQADSLTKQVASSSSSNLMSRNFYDSNYERSKYVQANLDGFTQEQSFANRMNSVMGSLIATAAIWNSQRNFGGAIPIENTYVIGQRMVNAAGQAVAAVKRDEVVENSKKNLEDIKEDMEDRAQEAISGEPAANVSPDGDITPDGEEHEIATGGSGEYEMATGGGMPAPTHDLPSPPSSGSGASTIEIASAGIQESVQVSIDITV